MISLSAQERERFAAYLEQEAAQNRALSDQVATMGGGPPMEMMAKKMRTEAAAQSVVAAILRSTHTDSIGGDE